MWVVTNLSVISRRSRSPEFRPWRDDAVPRAVWDL